MIFFPFKFDVILISRPTLAAFVIAVKDESTAQLKEGEAYRGVRFLRDFSLLCPGREGMEVGGALSVDCLPHKQAHYVTRGDLAQIPLPPPSITDLYHHAWFMQSYSGPNTCQTITLSTKLHASLMYTFLRP